MGVLPLSAEDLAILGLEGPTVAGHTCKLIELEAPGLAVEAVRERIAERITGEPLLTSMLGEAEAVPAWVPDPEFDLERQVGGIAAAPVGPGELQALVAEVFEQRLPRDRPLWRIDVAATEGGGTALIWRLHHALADGTAAMRFAREVLWDPDRPGEETTAPAATGGGPRGPHPSRRSGAEEHERRRAHLGAFIKREFAESLHRSPFDGEIGARRTVAFARLPFAGLHDAAKRLCGATINDAVLSIVAGALRSWTETHHGSLGTTRFRVPVSLHSEGDHAGNKDSFFTVPVHLDEPDPLVRLRAVHEQAAARKTERDAERLERLVEELHEHAPPLAGLAERLESTPRSFALCVSNVPGPRRPERIAGVEVRSIHTLAEIGSRHGLRVAVVSYAGDLCFGLLADPAIAEDIDAMAAGIEAEAEALINTA